jgi:glycosyltransferase involved in cell wall biosynthesis
MPIFYENNRPNQTKITIIIPIRNEVENIGKLIQDIDIQTYKINLFEVIVVNDCSDDGSKQLIESLIDQVKYKLILLDFPSHLRLNSPKKSAISMAINYAFGDLIITTDGDCRVESGWLKAFADCYEKTNFKLISGPVTFHHSKSIFHKLQIVEFASLIGTGAASIYWNKPNMCNGANLAYEKKAFVAVNGFAGYENQASGDDEFLMHKLADIYPNQIVFLKSKNAIVTTSAQPNLNSFINQRLRWASKWDAYQDIINSILAVYILLVNLFFMVSWVILIFFSFSNLLFLSVLFRILLEVIFIGKVLLFLNRGNYVKYIPIVQLLYPFYVVFIGVFSLKKSYHWKGRKY